REPMSRELRRHAVTERADVGAGPLRLTERLRQQICNGGLAVRARHADQRRRGAHGVESVREIAEPRLETGHGQTRRLDLRILGIGLEQYDRRPASQRLCSVDEPMLSATRHCAERGARRDLPAVEGEIGDRETPVAAGFCTEQLTERAAVYCERRHHGLTCACASTVSAGAGSASGGTAITRNAP